MTTPDAPPVGDGSNQASPVSREALEALTRDQLHEQFNVPRGTKLDMIQAIVDNDGRPLEDPEPDGSTVVLAVDGMSSNEHFWAAGEDPITVEGTAVPADQADEIIAQAAAGGVRVFTKEA